jgi:hypothetical protein
MPLNSIESIESNLEELKLLEEQSRDILKAKHTATQFYNEKNYHLAAQLFKAICD